MQGSSNDRHLEVTFTRKEKERLQLDVFQVEVRKELSTEKCMIFNEYTVACVCLPNHTQYKSCMTLSAVQKMLLQSIF